MPAMYVAIQAVLSLYASGRTTGKPQGNMAWMSEMSVGRMGMSCVLPSRRDRA